MFVFMKLKRYLKKHKLKQKFLFMMIATISIFMLIDDTLNMYLIQKYSYEIQLEMDINKYNRTILKDSIEYNKAMKLEPKPIHLPVNYIIGVLTAEKYLTTRAKHVYSTWGREVQNLNFYIGKTKHKIISKLPIVTLTNVKDTAYPPQAKSFNLLLHWCQSHLDQYDWFIKADDDVYIKAALLERFLWTLDKDKKYYIGRPGMGIPEEMQVLGLKGNRFCSGPTVIYSRSMMRELCPHLTSCINNVATVHEDTEIGRCVIKNLKQQCAVNYKPPPLHELFYTTYAEGFFARNLSSQPEFQTAISVHAVKESEHLFNIHYYYKMWLHEFNRSNKGAKLPVLKSNPLQVEPKPAWKK